MFSWVSTTQKWWIWIVLPGWLGLTVDLQFKLPPIGVNPDQSGKLEKMNRQSHPVTNEEYMDGPIRAGLPDIFLMPVILICAAGADE